MYPEFVAPTTTAPAVIFPNQPAHSADTIYVASSQPARVPTGPTPELAVGALMICEEPTQFGRFRYKVRTPNPLVPKAHLLIFFPGSPRSAKSHLRVTNLSPR